mmetsp:Transcript_21035/g.31957  ORF Transcript_21035/g.31957 Transcript_21035/m.31957 type:complete len:445 (+) Transcript_21035:579-1913(+)|eukprot:CAMPEP_0194120236 /NCGR_PEP_ID=MMETSP0150-20130528/42719_1 /TAXON_ID=122233 /ORGANISM="Chaetoceros debilis, Strain MM31A-1" /LENGTH=444 /DNA_ID=CAMNT_0038812265 /DNA_START=567 /DNA_END=1901 /DNA_ORIENTATION=-
MYYQTQEYWHRQQVYQENPTESGTGYVHQEQPFHYSRNFTSYSDSLVLMDLDCDFGNISNGEGRMDIDMEVASFRDSTSTIERPHSCSSCMGNMVYSYNTEPSMRHHNDVNKIIAETRSRYGYQRHHLHHDRALLMHQKPSQPTMMTQEAIECRRYDLLCQNLSPPLETMEPTDPNEEMLFLNKSVYMTGLEYAVFTKDWRMAILLYMHAADPKYNCFDGRTIIDMHDRAVGREGINQDNDIGHENPHNSSLQQRGISPRTSNALSNAAFLHYLSKMDDHVPISGFNGLYCLLNSSVLEDHTAPNLVEYNKTMSSLWLMEQTYGNVDTYMHDKHIIALTRSHLHKIGARSVWQREFCDNVYFFIQTIRRMKGNNFPLHNEHPHSCDYASSSLERIGESLSNDLCLHIMEYLVDDLLSHTIEKGLKFISDGSVGIMGCTHQPCIY